MQISARFTMAVHMFACVDAFPGRKMTSEFMAASIGTNPVTVRRLLRQLRTAGLLEVSRGTGGVTITRSLTEITFLDVYRAVECTCLLGADVGAYNTCAHGCRYCYANRDAETVAKNRRRHDRNSPFLIGGYGEGDVVRDAKQVSWRDGRISLFDLL